MTAAAADAAPVLSARNHHHISSSQHTHCISSSQHTHCISPAALRGAQACSSSLTGGTGQAYGGDTRRRRLLTPSGPPCPGLPPGRRTAGRPAVGRGRTGKPRADAALRTRVRELLEKLRVKTPRPDLPQTNRRPVMATARRRQPRQQESTEVQAPKHGHYSHSVSHLKHRRSSIPQAMYDDLHYFILLSHCVPFLPPLFSP